MFLFWLLPKFSYFSIRYEELVNTFRFSVGFGWEERDNSSSLVDKKAVIRKKSCTWYVHGCVCFTWFARYAPQAMPGSEDSTGGSGSWPLNRLARLADSLGLVGMVQAGEVPRIHQDEPVKNCMIWFRSGVRERAG